MDALAEYNRHLWLLRPSDVLFTCVLFNMSHVVALTASFWCSVV